MIRKAQRIRFKVFYEEMAAVPDGPAMLSRRDVDPYDRICDHLIVIDHAPAPKPFRKTKPKVVGTHRSCTRDVADRHRASTKEQSRAVAFDSLTWARASIQAPANRAAESPARTVSFLRPSQPAFRPASREVIDRPHFFTL